MVLNQVDEEFPVLIPALNERVKGIPAFITKWKRVYPEFNPPPFIDIDSIKKYIDSINEYIVEFNLELQTKFKEKGRQELYMMDDTLQLKNSKIDTHVSGKTYMHCLNGEDEDGTVVSQLNVLFPFKKMSSKSLYASQLKVRSYVDVDDILERARGITLQGKVSYKDCLQSVATVGNNLYMMSPTVDLMENGGCMFGNGLTIVNGYDIPYHFPHSMTLFQPSQNEYESSNIDDFIEWFNDHNRKTIVSINDTYGSNVSDLKILGFGSYELELATYSPTDLVLYSPDGEQELTSIGFNTDTYREIRSGSSGENKYHNGKYVFKNGVYDDEREGKFTDVGFLFNLYDTFISGNDRVLHVQVPDSIDYNNLDLKFEWKILGGELDGEMEVDIQVNEEYAAENESSGSGFTTFSYHISDLAIGSHDIEIVVRIHYQVDFGKRNTEDEYRNALRRSGVVLRNIRLEPPNQNSSLRELTFSDYLNENGVEDEEWQNRLKEFFTVSRYKNDVMYQTVLESSIRNMTSSGIQYKNNYSSGDLFGDMFVTKSVLDSRYDMDMWLDYWDDEANTWTDDHENGTQMIHAIGRDYIGMGNCSNQLSLLYKQTDVAIGYNEKPTVDKRVVTRKVNPEPELKYQMVEVVKNINRFESAIKHKSNVFSVVVENSNLAKSSKDEEDMTEEEMELEKYKEKLRDSVTQFVRNTCEGIVPVHTQLFDVQFT